MRFYCTNCHLYHGIGCPKTTRVEFETEAEEKGYRQIFDLFTGSNHFRYDIVADTKYIRELERLGALSIGKTVRKLKHSIWQIFSIKFLRGIGL